MGVSEHCAGSAAFPGCGASPGELVSRGGTPRKPAGEDARATLPPDDAKNSVKLRGGRIADGGWGGQCRKQNSEGGKGKSGWQPDVRAREAFYLSVNIPSNEAATTTGCGDQKVKISVKISRRFYPLYL